MQDYSKRRKSGTDMLRVLLGSLGVVALVVLAFFMLRGTWGMYQKFALASDARAAAERRLTDLESQLARTQEELKSFESERGVEAKIRERYGVARPGEGEIVIVRSQATTSAPQEVGGGFFTSLWDALFVW